MFLLWRNCSLLQVAMRHALWKTRPHTRQWMVVHTLTREVAAGGALWIQGQSVLPSEFQDSQGCTGFTEKPCLGGGGGPHSMVTFMYTIQRSKIQGVLWYKPQMRIFQERPLLRNKNYNDSHCSPNELIRTTEGKKAEGGLEWVGRRKGSHEKAVFAAAGCWFMNSCILFYSLNGNIFISVKLSKMNGVMLSKNNGEKSFSWL